MINPEILINFTEINLIKKIMGVDIKFSHSYCWLRSWILANIIQLGTQSFCERFVDFRIDPSHRLYDQMSMAARCGVANIAEGSSRHSTSIETEMRLLDVAKASFDELLGDYFNFLLRYNFDVWAIGNPQREIIWALGIDPPTYSNSLFHDAAIHIRLQKKKFDQWIESNSVETAANAMLILCEKENRMLQNQIQTQLENFRQNGGFTENMTQERLEAKKNKAAAIGAPKCPLCGKPMFKRMQRKGQNQGREFWSCSDWPRCNGIIPINPDKS